VVSFLDLGALAKSALELEVAEILAVTLGNGLCFRLRLDLLDRRDPSEELGPDELTIANMGSIAGADCLFRGDILGDFRGELEREVLSFWRKDLLLRRFLEVGRPCVSAIFS